MTSSQTARICQRIGVRSNGRRYARSNARMPECQVTLYLSDLSEYQKKTEHISEYFMAEWQMPNVPRGIDVAAALPDFWRAPCAKKHMA